MESDSPVPGDLSPDEARKALHALALAVDRAALADRVRTPWWYHLLLAVITAVFVGSPAVSSTTARSTLVTFGCVGLVFLVLAYKRVTGFSVSGDAGPRSRRGMLLLLAVVLLLFLGSMVLAATGDVPWVAATALAAFVVMVVGGRRYDRVFNEELRGGR